jgi:sarcosine oxidase subunit beta
MTGHLKLARSDEQAHELERYATIARKHGLALDLLNRGQLQNRYPYLDSDAIAGSLCAEDGQANSRLVAPAFARVP